MRDAQNSIPHGIPRGLRRLRQIDCELRRSDPRLASMFAAFALAVAPGAFSPVQGAPIENEATAKESPARHASFTRDADAVVFVPLVETVREPSSPARGLRP